MNKGNFIIRLAGGILLCNTVILYILTGIGFSAVPVKILTEILLFSVSWTIQKRAVFSHGKEVTG